MIESHFKNVSDVQDDRSKNLVNFYEEFSGAKSVKKISC